MWIVLEYHSSLKSWENLVSPLLFFCQSLDSHVELTSVTSINFWYFQNRDNELKDLHCAPPAATNIILNHDFSGGLHSWHPNCCDAFVVSEETGRPEGLSAKLSVPFAVITNRKECWQGLEQDITSRVLPGATYSICAWVGISSPLHGVSDVLATLKLECHDNSVSYLFIGR